ncbi:MAG: hypothetical protein LIO77_07880 [Rikenellaceae bacterium]|nr:hypothetical protein [Rikenellaceae bacterium]
MRSKVSIYILSVVAVLVWGKIVWNIAIPKETGVPVVPVKESPPVREKERRDSLWLNYRDPFLGTVEKESVAMEPEQEVEISSEKNRPDFNVLYFGKIIKNRTANHIVEIDGHQYIMRRGDTHKGYRITETYDDSLTFCKDGYYFSVQLSL